MSSLSLHSAVPRYRRAGFLTRAATAAGSGAAVGTGGPVATKLPREPHTGVTSGSNGGAGLNGHDQQPRQPRTGGSSSRGALTGAQLLVAAAAHSWAREAAAEVLPTGLHLSVQPRCRRCPHAALSWFALLPLPPRRAAKRRAELAGSADAMDGSHPPLAAAASS